MPATEQTCYDMRRLHKVFAVSSVLLTMATVWMFARDHYREWKSIQRTSDRIEMQLTRWQKIQSLSEGVVAERERLEQSLAETMARPFSEELIAAFRGEVIADAERRQARGALVWSVGPGGPGAGRGRRLDSGGATGMGGSPADGRQESARRGRCVGACGPRSRGRCGRLKQTARDLAAASRQAQLELEQAAAEKRSSEDAVVPLREHVLAALDLLVSEARFREEELLRARKVQLAELDVEKAKLGFGVRDQQPDSVLKQLQDEIELRKQRIAQLTLESEAAAEHRRQLRAMLDRMMEKEAAIGRRLDEIQAEVKRLDQLLAEKQSSYFSSWGILPIPGKKWLELPLLDVFNSPRKIENLWSEGLDRESGSFGRVRRFDRCTTCHQSEQKALPDASNQPAIRESRTIDFALQLPSEPSAEGDRPIRGT